MRLLIILLCLLFPSPPTFHTSNIPIEDKHNNMFSFYNSLYKLKSGKINKVRIAYYGDSNNSLDYASGYLRTFLGNEYGHGGHGYILAGQPLPWYQHRDIKTFRKAGWKTYQATIPKSPKYNYGHGGGVGCGYNIGSYAKFSTKNELGIFDTIVVHYLCTTGIFNITVDNKEVYRSTEICKIPSFRSIKINVSEGKHVVILKTIKPPVAILGLMFERKKGTVVDGFGIGGASIWHLSRLQVDKESS